MEFEVCWQQASESPQDDSAWDALEKAAVEHKRVEDAAALYREVLARPLPVEVALNVADRAVSFHDEWIDEPGVLEQVLARVLELDPTAQWAFDRMSLQMTAAGRWDDLLGMYDRVVAQTDDAERRAVLLEEAAHLAKDSAGQPERAVKYLLSVFQLQPANTMVAAALERLLRQQERYRELIDFWNERLAILRGEEALVTRQQIAVCWLENLNDPAAALNGVEPLLADASTAEAACRMLEQILASPASNRKARRAALAHLSKRYDTGEQWGRVVGALEAALQYVGDGELAELHGEIVRRLVDHELVEKALSHLAALIALDAEVWNDTSLMPLLAGEPTEPIANCSPEISAAQGRHVVGLAARLAADRFHDRERAIVLLQKLVADDPDDAPVVRELAHLYEELGRGEDLLDLRRQELGRAAQLEDRLRLRLEIARLLRAGGDERGAITALRDNLDEQIGHAASIRVMIEGLEALAAYQELADFLCEQAAAVEVTQARVAADLWARAARLAETKLKDFDSALDSYGRVVALLEDDTAALDALARIHMDRGEHGTAVLWLEKRLAIADPGARAETIIRLAKAHTGAAQHDAAVKCLREGLEEDPANLEMRQLLAGLYRRSGDWELLVAVLQDGAELADTPTLRFELLTEAARVYTNQLGTPERAISVLENARSINPEDRTIRTQLAESLRAARRLDEARELTQELIDELGRRRVPEKAALHLLLARVAEDAGAMDEALRQLQLAASVDVSNVEVQRLLGAAYRKVGDLEKAERAYQALLLILRRQGSEARTEVGVAEAMFEIHRVARDLGDAQRAQENLESAFDAASQSVPEALRFEAVLRSQGDGELLMRALRQRLDITTNGEERARILDDIASVLEKELGRPDEAFDAVLGAVGDLPSSPHLHERALDLAMRLDGIVRYQQTLARAVQIALENEDWPLACDLLLRTGRIDEDHENLDAAAEHYSRAEATGERQADVWRAMARVAAARGDRAAELTALRKVRDLPAPQLIGSERVEVLFRLAELQLAFPDALYEGLATLEQALDLDPQYPRAANALQHALKTARSDEQVVLMYERVARNSWDDELLLDALERRSELGGVGQDLLEEAYSIAERLQSYEVAEALLLRAIEVARDEVGELAQALWALRVLVQRRQDAEQLDDAVFWMREAAEVAPMEEARALLLRAASLAAGPLGNLELAADTYEQLLGDMPGDPTIWQPALDVVRRMGDKDRYERFLDTISDAVSDPQVRNQLRVAKARMLIGTPDRLGDAILTLEAVLDDDPEHAVAADLLADQLERAGRLAELAALLEKRIDMACEKRDTQVGTRLTLRLGDLLVEERKDEALSAYRALLEWAPQEHRVLEALYHLLDPEVDTVERADVLEQIVAHHVTLIERGEGDRSSAMDLALALVRVRDELADPTGMELALEQAFRIDPKRQEILDQLRRLAERLVEEAFRVEEKKDAVELLQKAAHIHWNRLDDPSAASGILREAHSLQPDNVTLVSKLVRCLIETDRPDAAVETITEALERHPKAGEERLRLLRLRASISSSAGHHESAVADLEEAMSIGGEGLPEELCSALREVKQRAASSGDHATERSATMRLAEVLRSQLNDAEAAREVLADWVQNSPLDRDAIYDLLQVDSVAGRWEDVAVGYARLMKLEEGDAQTDAAVKLADAYERAGSPEAARDPLESMYRIDQGNARLRTRLRRLYERIEAWRDLSNLLLVEANNADDGSVRFALLREAGEIRLNQLEAPATAIGPLMEALDLAPDDEELTLLLADAYTAAHFTDDAIQLLQQAIERHGDRRSKELAALQHRMARAVAATGDAQAELEWLTVAWESHPQSGEAASELVERAMRLESYDVALKALRALAAMRTPAPISRPMALFKQAQIAEIQGDARKAAFLAKKALSEDPELTEAEAFLKALQAG